MTSGKLSNINFQIYTANYFQIFKNGPDLKLSDQLAKIEVKRD